MIWTIASIVSFMLFILLVIVLMIEVHMLKFNPEITEMASHFIEDELLAEKDLAGNHNLIFANSQDSKAVVDRYVISEEEEKRFILCHLMKPLETANVLDLSLYNHKQAWIQTLRVEHPEAVEKMPLIELPKGTAFVNIHFYEKSDDIQTASINVRKKEKTFNNIAILETVALFFLLIPLGYGLLALVAGDNLWIYLNVKTLLLGIWLMGFASVVNYVILVVWFKRNSRSWRHSQ